MSDWATLTYEPRVTTSPLWLLLVDVHTGGPPGGPVEVLLERKAGTTWVPLDLPHQLSPRGDLGFLGLGRRSRGAPAAPFDVRVTVSAPRTLAETAGGQPRLEATITPWTPENPPPPGPPDVISFFPAPAYRFGPGVPVLGGRVIDAAGDPVDRARVSNVETVRGTPRTEEVRTDEAGLFRLPLRWSAGSTLIDARRGPMSGSVTVDIPSDLRSAQLITLT